MNGRIARSLLLGLVYVMVGEILPCAAQSAAPPEPAASDTIADYRDKLIAFYAAEGPKKVTEQTEETTEETAEAVAAKTTATAAPEGFAGRVNEAISDFLPLFQFAVQGVSTSEDDKSVTVKLNPPKFAKGVISISGTATEPAVFSNLAEEIAEPVRESQSKKLLEGIDDFSDTTATLEYGFLRQAGKWGTKRKLFGRDARIYQPLVSELLEAAWAGVSEAIKTAADRSDAALVPFLPQLEQINKRAPGHVTFERLRADLGPSFEHRLREGLAASAEAEAALHVAVRARLKALPTLVDNQPQLVFKVSQRWAEEILGPNSTAASISYEMGSKNFNAVLNEYHRLLEQRPGSEDDPNGTNLMALKLQALEAIVNDERFGSEDKLVFSFTYKDVDPYEFAHEYRIEGVDAPDAPMRTAVVDLERSRELRGKLLWTRFVRFPKREEGEEKAESALPNPNEPGFFDKAIPAEQKPRLTLSIESVDFKDDPTRHDQVIGKVTYLAPLSGGMALPVTLVWANRPEFVGEVDHQFSAHVGISYKLGREGKENEEK